MTLSVAATPTDRPLCLSLRGRATIDGCEVLRPAVPAEDLVQAFAYHHLVPVKQWLVTIAERRAASYWWQLADPKHLQLAAGAGQLRQVSDDHHAAQRVRSLLIGRIARPARGKPPSGGRDEDPAAVLDQERKRQAPGCRIGRGLVVGEQERRNVRRIVGVRATSAVFEITVRRLRAGAGSTVAAVAA